jgi:hydroxymethylglutaryl-CoA reductase
MNEDTFSSRLPGFYNLSLEERLERLADRLAPEDLRALSGEAGLGAEQADQMIENTIGVHSLPLGVALNFLVNGRDRLVPMAIEEHLLWLALPLWPSWFAPVEALLPTPPRLR